MLMPLWSPDLALRNKEVKTGNKGFNPRFPTSFLLRHRSNCLLSGKASCDSKSNSVAGHESLFWRTTTENLYVLRITCFASSLMCHSCSHPSLLQDSTVHVRVKESCIRATTLEEWTQRFPFSPPLLTCQFFLPFI